MTTALVHPANGHVSRPSSSSLADVIDIILDKGMVIDAYVRVSLVGIELLTIDARIVIASVDTYLRFAEAVNRLQIGDSGPRPGLPELVEGVGHKLQGAHNPVSSMVEAIERPVRKVAKGLTAKPVRKAAKAMLKRPEHRMQKALKKPVRAVKRMVDEVTHHNGHKRGGVGLGARK